MQPGVLKVSQECRGMNKSKCCQLRQFVFIPAWKSNLLHHIEFAIFFLVPSQAFTIFCGPLLHPQTEPIKHCFDFSAHTVLPWPPRKSCLCFWACFGAHTRTPSSTLFGDLAPSDACLLSATTVISSLFLPFQCFSILKKKVRKKHVSGAVYISPVPSLGREDPLEEEMTTHSSILAWRIPWTEEPGGLQPMGSQRVGHDWATEHMEVLPPIVPVYLNYSCYLN